MVVTGSASSRRRNANSSPSPSQKSTPPKRKRSTGTPGRPGRTPGSVSQHAKEQHEAEATALTEGIDQLDQITAALNLLREGGSLPKTDSLPRDWMSEETLVAMTEVIDENPRPSLEYVLGVLGATQVPKRLAERQRSSGARAFTSHLRNRAIRRKREAIEEKKKAEKIAAEEAAEKERIAREKENAEREQLEKKTAEEQREKDMADAADAEDEQMVDSDEKPELSAENAPASQPDGGAVPSPDGQGSVRVPKPEPVHGKASEPVSIAVEEKTEQSNEKAEVSKRTGKKSGGKAHPVIASEDRKTAVPGKQKVPGKSPKPSEVPAPSTSKSVAIDMEVEVEDSAVIAPAQKSASDSKQAPLTKKQEAHPKEAASNKQVKPMKTQDAVEESEEKAKNGASNTTARGKSEQKQPRPLSKARAAAKDAVMDDTTESLQPEKIIMRPESKDIPSPDAKTEEQAVGEKPGDAEVSPFELDLVAATAAAAAAVSNDSREPESNKTISEKKAVEVSAPLEMAVVSDTLTDPIAVKLKPQMATSNTSKHPKESLLPAEVIPAADAEQETKKDVSTSETPTKKSLRQGRKEQDTKDKAADKKSNVMGKTPPSIEKNQSSSKKTETQLEAEELSVGDRKNAPKLTVPPRKAMSPGRRRERETARRGKQEDHESDEVASDDKGKANAEPSKGLKEKLNEIAKEEEGEKKAGTKQPVRERSVKKIEHRVPKKRFQDAKEERVVEIPRTPKDVDMQIKGATPSSSHGTKKETSSAAKARKQKEKEKAPERRTGTRRKGYSREGLVQPHAPQTRLRRESFNLLDHSTLPSDTDKFIVDCFVVWKTINQEKIAIPFRRPVTVKDAPEYFEVVKNPMDLSTVRKHLEDKTIKTPEDFYSEMLLICSNAMLFNDAESDLYDLAQELRQKIRKEVKPVLKAWRAATIASKESEGNREAIAAVVRSTPKSPVAKPKEASSDSEKGSDGSAHQNTARGSARYPARRGTSSVTKSAAPRGRKRTVRGRSKTAAKGSARKSNDLSDDDFDVVTIPPPRGRRGGRGGTGRRGTSTREAGGAAARKRTRPAPEEPDEGRKRRRISGRKRRDED